MSDSTGQGAIDSIRLNKHSKLHSRAELEAAVQSAKEQERKETQQEMFELVQQSAERALHWEAEVEKLKAEKLRWKKAIEGLTPSGSEFVDDPEYCAAYIRRRTEYPRMIIELRQDLTTLRAGIAALAKKWRQQENNSPEYAMVNGLMCADELAALLTEAEKGKVGV